jgi:glutaredoxin-like YruB-family protein
MAKKVTIYSTPTCPYCNSAKEFFNAKSIEYNEIDVSTDTKAAEEMTNKSGQMGVPVIVIEENGNEEVVVGFDKAKIVQLLGITE